MLFRTAYGDHNPMDYASYNEEPSLTHQSMSDACDINNIMKRYEKTGLLEHVAQYDGNYGDFTGAKDYLDSLLQVQEAQLMFASLPADIRSKFDNEPAKFLEFVEDPLNRSEMARMGLLNEVVASQVLAQEAVSKPSGEAARSET